MKALFKNEELQKQFEEDGFVKINLLNATEVAALIKGYDEVKAEHESINIPYITTSHSNNAELIAKVDTLLQAIMAPAIDKYLTEYKLLFGNYLVKMAVKNSDTSPHQDITFVDEPEFASVNIWVALQETTPENGCMYFLKGSHNFIPTIRPTHHYPWAYENVKEQIKQHADVFPAKPGEAFIFNHAVLHGSFANSTSQPRLAAVIAAYNAQAPLIHYYLPNGETHRLQKYSMTKDAYLSFVKERPPQKGVFLHEVEYEFKQVSPQQFEGFLKKQQKPISIAERIRKMFS